ncbi:hypothetical protein ACEXQB_005655 [Herbiconiux sp. P18]|uniref:hypothetical protein n=1 Tax=Herbiconiux liangxiaofengii TaxID=3342795 RepID=UPI0035B762E9
MSTTTQSTTVQGPVVHRIRDGYWRVSGASGAVLGYVEESVDGFGVLYRAKRRYSSGLVGDIGEFSAREDAVECLR